MEMDTIPPEMLATPKALRFHHFPWSILKPNDPSGSIMLPGASRAALQKLPVFLYDRCGKGTFIGERLRDAGTGHPY
jgi:hypothetical protein